MVQNVLKKQVPFQLQRSAFRVPMRVKNRNRLALFKRGAVPAPGGRGRHLGALPPWCPAFLFQVFLVILTCLFFHMNFSIRLGSRNKIFCIFIGVASYLSIYQRRTDRCITWSHPFQEPEDSPFVQIYFPVFPECFNAFLIQILNTSY